MTQKSKAAEKLVRDVAEKWKSQSKYDYSLKYADTHYENDVFVFDLTWSQPTPVNPIPKHIVRVQFFVDMGQEPKKITFKIEHHTLDHSIDLDFTDKWFDEVIALKEKIAADM